MTIYFTAGGLLGTSWINSLQLVVMLGGFLAALPFAHQREVPDRFQRPAHVPAVLRIGDPLGDLHAPQVVRHRVHLRTRVAEDQARALLREPYRVRAALAARDAGATLGAGSIVVFDETSDLLEMARRVARFFRDESCGQCVPCRVGTVRQEELLARLSARAPLGSVDAELALLDDLGAVMRDASICGLGQAANAAVASALRLPGVLPGAAR